jgi:hypothetical protein
MLIPDSNFVAIHREKRGGGQNQRQRFHLLYATGVVVHSTPWVKMNPKDESDAVAILLRFSYQHGQNLRTVKYEGRADSPMAYFLHKTDD